MDPTPAPVPVLAPAAAELPQAVLDAAADALEVFRHYDTGRHALTLSGSMSKGTSDALSDVDFRFYSDKPRPVPGPGWEPAWQALRRRWDERGVVLDEPWFRTVAEVDASVDSWLAGDGVPDELIWTIWGYHPLADLARQIAVYDEDDLVGRWRARLEPYPDSVRVATLRRHLPPLLYWRGDYHYRNKTRRGDLVFLAGLTTKLVHHVVQAWAALNRAHYPGDGNNLRLVSTFSAVPARAEERITRILYPTDAADTIGQRERLIALIDETMALVRAQFPGQEWGYDH
ncbi:DUF4037 domain-containing protein [Actinospica durhamensis]|uniref:DUF4037 domain-containing protein n=1 Tax=Actinospica durhamensis TaxID=1508375 RepID=A0A941IP29_9ACTN|nr:DUF4037 domain-containing protein [Actinospica durhamensis]MBR7836085.1 DUF4037 domain-containing protein [Actinospica durhamensis]